VARTEICASAVVPHPPERVFEFLSDLRNHWQLEDRFVELESLDGDARGGRVRMVGPLGLGRTARTRVVEAEAPSRLRGSAELGATRAAVRWDIEPVRDGSLVRLSAAVERASVFDRVLLAAGGRAWLERLFASAVSRVDRVLAAD
jgi:uncharacterized protein YndB with AHSA1/START domain